MIFYIKELNIEKIQNQLQLLQIIILVVSLIFNIFELYRNYKIGEMMDITCGVDIIEVDRIKKVLKSMEQDFQKSIYKKMK